MNLLFDFTVDKVTKLFSLGNYFANVLSAACRQEPEP
jgi:hypothetical protein